jgi:hypothetical protein
LAVRSWCKKALIHCPVVVFAQRHSIGRVVIPALREWDEMSGVNEGNFRLRDANPQAAGATLVIVLLQHEAPEAGRARNFGLICYLLAIPGKYVRPKLKSM